MFAFRQTAAEEMPVLADVGGSFTFVVLGDTHYIPPDYKVSPFIHDIGREIDALPQSPAFVCLTGDVVEGGVYELRDGKRKFVLANYDEVRSQLVDATRDLDFTFHRPVFIAVGNHDKHDPGRRAFGETALPLISKGLKHPVEKNHYAFRCGNACLIFVDFAPNDYEEQTRFVEQVLAKAKVDRQVQHVFLFAHYPLWAVVRAGFSNEKFSDSLLPLLLRYPPDAYFCGHTHNSIVCVRKFGTGSVVQIQGVSNGRGETLLPIEKHNALLFPPAEVSYLWGYREGSSTGYYLVHVDGPKVDVEWRVPGKGAIHEFGWREVGKLVDVKRPSPPVQQPVTDEALRNVQSADLVFCPWSPERTAITVTINGQQVAAQELRPTQTSFWEEARVRVAKEKLSAIGRDSVVSIGNPGRAVFGIAAARLEIVLRDGSRLATPVDRAFHFSCQGVLAGQPKVAKTRPMVPASLIREVELGQPLGPMRLSFSP
jgi:hypothetical protein